MQPWRKVAKQAFLSALSTLTSDQRIAIARAVEELAKDPNSQQPIIYINGDREIDVAAVWLRYRLDTRTREIIFLTITKY